MALPITFTYRTKGAPEMVRHFATAGDRVKREVAKTLREYARDLQTTARAYAPKFSGDRRSPASRRYGPLAASINFKVRAGQLGVKMSERPTAFYGLMVEHGYRKYAAGERRWAGKNWRTVKRKAYTTGGNYVADSRYDTFEVSKRGKRTLVAQGIRPSRVATARTVAARLGTAKAGSVVPGHPYMSKAWAVHEGDLPDLLTWAIKRGIEVEGA